MEQDPDRRAAIVEAAASVFLRYGFRKSSMDDMARTLKMTRQGVYFHFPNKETLFREVVQYLAGRTLEAARSALARSELTLESRLLAAFEGMSTRALLECDPASVQELFTSAAELASDLVQKLDEEIISLLAAALTLPTKARRPVDLPPRALAEHLYVSSYGLKSRGLSGPPYLEQMKTAIRIVCNSTAR